MNLTISDYNTTEGNNVTIGNFTDVINGINVTNNCSLTEFIDNVTNSFSITDSDNTNITCTTSSDLNTTTNTTSAGAENPNSHGIHSFYVTLFGVAFPGLCANVLAAYCLAFDVRKKTSLVKHFLLALCVVDILGMCSVVVHHGILSFVTNASTTLCSVNSFFVGFLPLMSGALTTMMAVERCIKFRAPFWHSINLWSWKLKIPVFLTTALLATVALLPASGLGFIMSQDGSRRCLTFPSTVPRMYNSPEGIHAITYATVGLTTVLVDVSCNIAVIITLVGVKGKRAEISESGEGKSMEMAMTRMLFWLSATFLITLSPLYVSLVVLYSGTPLSRSVKTVAHFLAGLNYTLDPFIYLIMMKTYRRRVTHLLRCCRRTKEVVGKSDSSHHQNNPGFNNCM